MLHFGFVMEQTLGHVTHHQNLARWVAEDAGICPTWMPIAYDAPDVWERIPGVRGNWSLKAEYLYADFGKISTTSMLTAPPGKRDVFAHSATFNVHVVRLGLNYRF